MVQVFFNWEPLELPENGSDMVVSLGPADNFTGKVIDSLEFGSVLMLACLVHNNITKTYSGLHRFLSNSQ